MRKTTDRLLGSLGHGVGRALAPAGAVVVDHPLHGQGEGRRVLARRLGGRVGGTGTGVDSGGVGERERRERKGEHGNVVNGDHGEWMCEIRRRWKVIRVVRCKGV